MIFVTYLFTVLLTVSLKGKWEYLRSFITFVLLFGKKRYYIIPFFSMALCGTCKETANIIYNILLCGVTWGG